MTIFDVSEKEGTFFDLEGGGRVQLRTLQPKDMQEILKAAVKKGPPEYPKLDGKYQRFQPETVDNELLQELLWDKTILAWENILDLSGNLIPCTKEWKIKLMYHENSLFRDFYTSNMQIMRDADAEKIKEAAKN